MQLTIFGIECGLPRTLSVHDERIVEDAILSVPDPRIFPAYFLDNLELLELKADRVLEALSEDEVRIAKTSLLDEVETEKLCEVISCREDGLELFAQSLNEDEKSQLLKLLGVKHELPRQH